MKILQVIDRLNVGGAERVLVDLTNILYENNHDVSVLFLLYPGPLGDQINPNIPQFILNRKSKLNLKTYYQCAQYLNQFDIIHCHHRFIYSYIKLTSILFKIRGKIILHDHFGPIDIDKSIPLGLRWILKPNYFIGVSQTLVSWATDQLKLLQRNTFLLPNIIRKRFEGTATKRYDLILVSNIKPIKNQLFAIALAKKLNRKLLILGHIQDEEYYALVQEAIVGTNIEVITDCNDTHAYIAKSQFGLHVSTSETGPLVLIEYLAYGIPFLAYDTGEVAALCKQTFPNMIINNFNESHWCNNITEIESENNNALKTKLLDYYSSHFNEESYLSKCVKIYENISHDY